MTTDVVNLGCDCCGAGSGLWFSERLDRWICSFCLDESIAAIVARIDGEWDNPALMKYGPQTPDPFEDIKDIAKGVKHDRS